MCWTQTLNHGSESESMKASPSKPRVETMNLNQLKANIDAALARSEQTSTDAKAIWLDETVLAEMRDTGVERLPADVGFSLGSAPARFVRIAREVLESDGYADPIQSAEAAAALRTIAEILEGL